MSERNSVILTLIIFMVINIISAFKFLFSVIESHNIYKEDLNILATIESINQIAFIILCISLFILYKVTKSLKRIFLMGLTTVAYLGYSIISSNKLMIAYIEIANTPIVWNMATIGVDFILSLALYGILMLQLYKYGNLYE